MVNQEESNNRESLGERVFWKLPFLSTLKCLWNFPVEAAREGFSLPKYVSKLAGHAIYAIGTIGAIYSWGVVGATTGEFNPLEQPQALRASREAYQSRMNQMAELQTALFGDNGLGGLADVNGDGLTLTEKMAALLLK